MTGMVMIYLGAGCVGVALLGLLITAIAFPIAKRKRIAKITDL